MRIKEALDMAATQSQDVDGIEKRVGNIVRRKFPGKPTKMGKSKKRKNKKTEDEDEEAIY